MKKISFLLLFQTSLLFAQTPDELFLKQIYSSALTQSSCYSWLDDLSNKIGQRLSGSKGAELAVAYTKSQLDQLGVDKVYLQEVTVPKWVRGAKEQAYLQVEGKKIPFSICALGLSVATPPTGISASV
ncbi:MAG: peptidase M28 family protein, partial [Flavobacterium sp.]|nr:peptidase M28 family protein [Flavobacterium sp.]